jgi:hypothetical protein
MEKIPRIEKVNAPATPEDQGTVERDANFEGNETEILIERLRNPVIKNQILDILYQQKADRRTYLENEEWEPYLPEGWDGTERFKLLLGKKTGKIMDTEALHEELNAPRATREAIEKELDADISQVEHLTEIDFTSNGPDAGAIPLNWVVPWTDKKPTPKQMSIAEAHEKGHRIRPYNSLTEKFRTGFDIANVRFTQEYYDMLKKDAASRTDKLIDEPPELTLEEQRERYLNDYLFTGIEIAERMSQLKNYFGFKGDEIFTEEHLRYAKEHYIKDTGMDNGMRLFFEGITPATEETFLEIINNSGI